jgi:hypothetical protein
MPMNHPTSENGPYVDEVNIGNLELHEGQRILYLFDYGDSWEFNIVLEKIDSNGRLPLNPKIVEKNGKAPKQYRYFSLPYESFQKKLFSKTYRLYNQIDTLNKWV